MSRFEHLLNLSFLRFSLFPFLSIEDISVLFRSVHANYRKGISILNWLDVVQPASFEVVRYLFSLLKNYPIETYDFIQVVTHLCNYILGIDQVWYNSLIKNAQNSQPLCTVDKQNSISLLHCNILDCYSSSFVSLFKFPSDEKFLLFMNRCIDCSTFITVHSLVDYFQNIIHNAFYDELFQDMLLQSYNCKVDTIENFMNRQSLFYSISPVRTGPFGVSLCSAHVFDLIKKGYSGFTHRLSRNVQFHESFLECVKYGNMEAGEELADLFFAEEVDYHYVKQLFIRIMKSVTLPVSMVSFIVSTLRISADDCDIIFRELCESNEFNLHVFPIQVHCIRYLQSRNPNRESYSNFVSYRLISSWQRIVYLYWSFNNASISFLHKLTGFIHSDGYLNSAHVIQNWRLFHSNWESILFENRFRVLHSESLFTSAIDAANQLLVTESNHLPPWVSPELIHSIHSDYQQISNYANIHSIPQPVLHQFYFNLISAYCPPTFPDFNKCELALILNNLQSFWSEYRLVQNTAEGQRIIAMSCAVGNVDVLCKFDVAEIPIRPCVAIAYVCNQKCILDVLFTMASCMSSINLNGMMKDIFFANDFPFMSQFCAVQSFKCRSNNPLCLQ